MRHSNLKILVIDDDEADRFMIERAFRQIGVSPDDIRFAVNGEEAIAYVAGEGKFSDRERYPFPAIVMTDLKMPRGDGFTVLEYLKSKPESKIIPVLVLSGGADADDIKRAYAMGASCYLQKRSGTGELQGVLKLFYDFWLECEVPVIDIKGKQVPTSSAGKLGERFGPMK